MTFNIQSIVAQSSKQLNNVKVQAFLSTDTFSQAWTLSDERNKEAALKQQAEALKALFD